MFGDVTFAQAPFAALGGNTFSAAISEVATGSAQNDLAVTKVGSQDESADVFHTQSAIAVLLASLLESSTGSDAVSNTANTLFASSSESTSVSSAPTATKTVPAFQFEASTALAVGTATASLLASLSESVTAVVAVSSGTVLFALVSEGADASAAQASAIAIAGFISEGAAGSATFVPLREANVRPNGVQLVINIGGVLVWAQIDDIQNPNWQNIVNAQGSGWTVITDTQTPGWTHLPS